MPGGGVSLDEDVVAAAGVVLAAEEVVEADLVQRRRRCIGRDVASHTDSRALGAMHHDRGVPADHLAEAALELLVTGEPRFRLGGDGVHVVGGGQCGGDRHPLLAGAFEEPQHEVTGSAGGAGGVEKCIERVEPLGGLVGIDVGQIGRDAFADDADSVSAPPGSTSVGARVGAVLARNRVLRRLVHLVGHGDAYSL